MKALTRLGATCHEFRSLILDDIDSVWQNLYYKLWPKHHIKSIDEGDWRDEFTRRFTIQSLQRTEISQSNNAILPREGVINTLVSFHNELKLDPNTLYLAVRINERYMDIKAKKVRIKTVSFLWVAANVTQQDSGTELDINKFARIGRCTTQDIVAKQRTSERSWSLTYHLQHHTSF